MIENNSMIPEDANTGSENGGLIHRLQKEDSRNLKVFNNFRWIFLVFIVFYTFFMIINPFIELGLPDRISGGCYVLGFMILGWIFRKYYREYKEIDYSLPVVEMLQKAADRYALKNRKTPVLIIPLLLIDAGITITIYQRYTMLSPWERIGIVQLIYFSLIIISFLIGILIWYKRQKPIRDEALKLIYELRS